MIKLEQNCITKKVRFCILKQFFHIFCLFRFPKGFPTFGLALGPTLMDLLISLKMKTISRNILEKYDFFRQRNILILTFCSFQEIIGGCLDIEPSKWTRPKMENFDDQMKRIINLKNKWNTFLFENK